MITVYCSRKTLTCEAVTVPVSLLGRYGIHSTYVVPYVLVDEVVVQLGWIVRKQQMSLVV